VAGIHGGVKGVLIGPREWSHLLCKSPELITSV